MKKRGRPKGGTVASGSCKPYKKKNYISMDIYLRRWAKRNPSKVVMFDLAGSNLLAQAITNKSFKYKDKLKELVALRDSMLKKEIDKIK